MTTAVLVDTGPLVASLFRRDEHHAWARTHWEKVTAPLLTCEAVLSETCFLLQRWLGRCDEAIELIRRRAVEVPFRLEDEVEAVSDLMRRYADVPMSLADACLVRMSEQYSDCIVWTLDADFRRYRRHSRRAIPLWIPTDRT